MKLVHKMTVICGGATVVRYFEGNISPAVDPREFGFPGLRFAPGVKFECSIESVAVADDKVPDGYNMMTDSNLPEYGAAFTVEPMSEPEGTRTPFNALSDYYRSAVEAAKRVRTMEATFIDANGNVTHKTETWLEPEKDFK